jgi:predicted NAD/FAD-binding protein
MSRARVAVIGAGVAGLTAAYLLQRRYEVMLFEADARLGGHAHTHDLPTPDGGYTAVDSGFIVHNERTYPNLIRLFEELGVPTQDSEMSMSVRCDGCGLEYAGSKRLPGLFAQRASLVRGRYLRMLAEVTRFHRHARRVMVDERAGDVTLGAFLAIGGYTSYFTQHFMAPLVSAVWSAGESVSLDYPARYLFTFLANHGMLSVGGSPQWKTVVGGSRRYVERAAKGLSAVEVSAPIRAVTRTSGGVAIRDDADQIHEVDKVVIATHADQALRLLVSPSVAEREALGAFRYSRNETWLHSDPSVLPVSTRARASWNYLKASCHDGGGPVLVSYDMNRLMRLASPVGYVVTLNATNRVAPDSVIARMVYEHPIYTPSALAAQRRLPALNDGTVAYAGAYHGWGFHEDGCAAGVRAAESLGVTW